MDKRQTWLIQYRENFGGFAVVPTEGDAGTRVLDAMEAALAMLDAGDFPADIGAHLDLARCRLREHLGFPLPSIDLDTGLGPSPLAM